VYSTLKSTLLPEDAHTEGSNAPAVAGYLKIQTNGVFKKALKYKRRYCIINPTLRCLFYWRSKKDRLRPYNGVAKCYEGIMGFTELSADKLRVHFAHCSKTIKVGADKHAWVCVLTLITATVQASRITTPPRVTSALSADKHCPDTPPHTAIEHPLSHPQSIALPSAAASKRNQHAERSAPSSTTSAPSSSSSAVSSSNSKVENRNPNDHEQRRDEAHAALRALFREEMEKQNRHSPVKKPAKEHANALLAERPHPMGPLS
jgi:hypothetical protein